MCFFQESGEKPGEAGKSCSGGELIRQYGNNFISPIAKGLHHVYCPHL